MKKASTKKTENIEPLEVISQISGSGTGGGTDVSKLADLSQPENSIDPDLAPMLVGLTDEKSVAVRSSFQEFFEVAREWDAKARTIVVTDISQKEEMKQADEVRKLLKKKRGEVEARRKQLKEQIIIEGKAIDGAANLLKGLFEPAEKYLEEQATFADRWEEEQNIIRAKKRLEELSPFDTMAAQYDLVKMSDETYARVLSAGEEATRTRKEQEEENVRLREQDAARQRQLEELKALQAKMQEDQETARIASIELQRTRHLMSIGVGVAGSIYVVPMLREGANLGKPMSHHISADLLGRLTEEAFTAFANDAQNIIADNELFRKEVAEAVMAGLSQITAGVKTAPPVKPFVAGPIPAGGYAPANPNSLNRVPPPATDPELSQRSANAIKAQTVASDQEYLMAVASDINGIQTSRMLLTTIQTEYGQKINSNVNELLNKVRAYIGTQINNWP